MTVVHQCASNNGTLGSFSNSVPTSLFLLHTPYTCAFKPGCLMSHNWLHTPDYKVLNGMNDCQQLCSLACFHMEQFTVTSAERRVLSARSSLSDD